MKNKLLIVTTQAENAGAQKAALKLYTYMEAKGLAVKTSYLYSLDESYTAYIKTNYQSHVFMPSRKISKLLSLFSIREFVRVNEISHVISYTHWSNILVPILLFGCNVKVIANKRGGLWKYPFVRFFEGIILNSALVNKVICVSKGTYIEAKNDQSIPENKLYHIPNGIKMTNVQNKNHYSKGECFNFLFVGRLHEQKGIEYLIKGFDKFFRQNKELNFKLTVVGGGQLSKELKDFIQAVDISSYIDFVGNVSDVKSYYLDSHILVSTSLWEGFPNVLLEAASYRLPIVATNIDGSNELIKDRVSGYLFPSADADSVAKALEYSFYNYAEMVGYSKELINVLNNEYSDTKIRESYYRVLFED